MNGVKFLVVVMAASLAAFAGAAGAIFYLDATKEQEKIAASEQEKLEQEKQERLRPVSPKEAFISLCTYENSSFEGRSPEVFCELTWDNVTAIPMDAHKTTRETGNVDSAYMECIHERPDLTREGCLEAAGDPYKPWTAGYEKKRTESCLWEIDYYEEGRIKPSLSDWDRGSLIRLFYLYSKEELTEMQGRLAKQRQMKEEDQCSSKENMEEYLDIVARIAIATEVIEMRKNDGRWF